MTGFQTLLYKEVLRFWKVSFQTVAAPVLTALLYLLIFSHVLDARLLVNGVRTATYCKQRLPNYEVFDEERYFESGDRPCVVTLKGVALLATVTCRGSRYETVRRRVGLRQLRWCRVPPPAQVRPRT